MKIISFLFGFLLLISIACGSSSSVEPTATPQELAWTACTVFVKQQLDIPTGDAQRYTPSGVTTLADGRFMVEVYYANQGSTYRCELVRHPNGNTELLSLDVK